MQPVNRNLRVPPLGFVALPVMCALLASVLVLTIHSPHDDGAPKDPAPSPEDLAEQMAQLSKRIAAAATEQNLLAWQSGLALLDNAVASLAEREKALQEQKEKLQAQVDRARLEAAKAQQLHAQLQQVEAESESCRRRIQELEKQAVNHQAGNLQLVLGDYRGAYVLGECVEEGLIVYPNRRVIGIDAPPAELNSLFDEIERLGFVVLVVRPSGFDRSYGKFRDAIYSYIDSVQEKRGKRIGRCSFPIEADAPIDRYLNKGGRS